LVLNVTGSVKGMLHTPFFAFLHLFPPFSIFFYLFLPSENKDLNAIPKKQPKTQTSKKGKGLLFTTKPTKQKQTIHN
jgi:hypothetical protein